MSTSELKYSIFKMIDSINDESRLQEIYKNILSKQPDWWNTLTAEEKKSIEQGLEDVKTGNLLSRDKVMSKMQSKYPQLKF